MSERIYLGKAKDTTTFEMVAGEKLWVEKHNWDCEWYWGFGYIGNRNLHCHFEQFCNEPFDFHATWETTPFTENELWVILDCFIQAYALKRAAEVYYYGGNCINSAYRNIDKAGGEVLNKDLKNLLDWVWNFMLKEVK